MNWKQRNRRLSAAIESRWRHSSAGNNRLARQPFTPRARVAETRSPPKAMCEPVSAPMLEATSPTTTSLTTISPTMPSPTTLSPTTISPTTISPQGAAVSSPTTSRRSGDNLRQDRFGRWKPPRSGGCRNLVGRPSTSLSVAAAMIASRLAGSTRARFGACVERYRESAPYPSGFGADSVFLRR